MAGPLKIAALSLSAAALAAGLATACSAEERKPYAEKDDMQPRTSLSPCSARLAVIRAPRLATSGPAEDVVEDAFAAERLIGVAENVEVLTGDGGFLRVPFHEDSVNVGSADDENPHGVAPFDAPPGTTKAPL